MRWSASKLPLLQSCGYSARPDVTVPDDPGGPAAARGRARHEAFETWLRGLPHDGSGCEWDDQLDSVRTRFLAGARQLGISDACETETIRVLDVLTGGVRRSMYARSSEDPARRPSEIRLVADAFASGVVVDWKTGRHRESSRHQIDALALAFSATLGILAYVDDTGAIVDVHRYTYDEWDHAATLGALRAIYARESTAEPVAGLHCRDAFCPLLGACPATSAALAQAGVPRTVTLDPETPEEARDLLLAREVARGWYTRADDALRRYVDERGAVPLGDGRTYAAHETQRETITLTPEAIASVDLPPDALRVSTSKTAIRTSVGAARAREILSQLGELGCVTVTTSRRYETK